MKKINLFHLLLGLTLCLSQLSCKGQNKTIETNKGAAILDTDNPKNYSYKGYDLFPLAVDNYTMPMEIGSRWLVKYSVDGETGSRLRFHTITDTTTYDKYSRYPSTGPIFDEGIRIADAIASSIVNTYFFKGFKAYNKDLDISNIRLLPEEFEDIVKDDEDYTREIIPWEIDGKTMIFVNRIDYYEKDGKRKLSEVSLADDKITQIILKYNHDYLINLISVVDYDGDGKSDIILQARKDLDEKKTVYYYLLFLSSEAEEGQLVKHVATRKIESINKASED